jgi:hypothetical protein
MFNNIATNIKGRETARDVFYTPPSLAKMHIDKTKEYSEPNDIWFDPFKGKGVYYDNYPTENKVWTEISEGRDFFAFTGACDVICSNPPYSIINEVLEQSIKLQPRIISLLIGSYHFSPKRLEILENSGYGCIKVVLMKVHDWFGVSTICIFKKGAKSVVDFDRTIYYTDDDKTKRNSKKQIQK